MSGEEGTNSLETLVLILFTGVLSFFPTLFALRRWIFPSLLQLGLKFVATKGVRVTVGSIGFLSATDVILNFSSPAEGGGDIEQISIGEIRYAGRLRHLVNWMLKTLIPLNERKATFDSTREELKRWQTWAKEKITKSKGAFSSFDGGNKDSGQQSHHHRHHHHDTTNNDPVDEQSLVTELEWLLEDVVANEGKSDDISMRMNFDQLTALWNKRIDDRYPIQYLTKSSQFRTVSLYVAPGVLIPRPETELLIDFAYQHVKIYGKNEHLKELPWLDLGTGSGAIACALATELKDMFSKTNPGVYATDFSKEALEIAKINVERLRLNDTVSLLHGSWFDALREHNGIKFAGIVSNPPYIPSDVAANLQPEVGRHEPMSALDGRGELGMGDLDVICEFSHEYLAPGGFLALETHGGEQALRVWEKLWKTNLYEDVRVRSDYAGVDRFVTARLIDAKKVHRFSNTSFKD